MIELRESRCAEPLRQSVSHCLWFNLMAKEFVVNVPGLEYGEIMRDVKNVGSAGKEQFTITEIKKQHE